VKVLLRFTNVLEIVGDIVKVRVPIAAENHEAVVKFGDLALLENSQGESLVAQVISINREVVALQVFAGTKGVSTNSSVRFLGHPMLVTYSDNVFQI
jgi:V/A-type H+-transporting ATPase subunit B